MELTSPEDEIAIKDIEKQLLNSVESFPNYMGSESHSRSMSPNSYTMNGECTVYVKGKGKVWP